MIVNGFLISDDAEIVNQFNRYFALVAEDLVNNIPTTESIGGHKSVNPLIRKLTFSLTR